MSLKGPEAQGIPAHLKHVAEILGGTAPKLILCTSDVSQLDGAARNRVETAAKPNLGPVAPVPSFIPTGGSAEEKKALAATEAALNARRKAAAVMEVSLLEWDCTPGPSGEEATTQLASIRTSMGITTLPTLLALDNGELCDKIEGTADMEGEKVITFIAKFKEYCAAKKERPTAKASKGVVSMPSKQSGGGGDTAAATTHMTVDVDKMVKMGRDMIAKREPLYAEKFFLKALGVLDVAASEGGVRVDQVDDNMEGSIALTLAWVIIAQMLQSRPSAPNAPPAKVTANNCEACDRLERDFEKWITPASQCSLAVALREMFRYMPCSFDHKATPATLMEKIKSYQQLVVERSLAKVQGNAKEGSNTTTTAPASQQSGTVLTDEEQRSLMETRCQLVIVFLLSLDVERAATEAMKIDASGHDFGGIALRAIKRKYLGDDL